MIMIIYRHRHIFTNIFTYRKWITHPKYNENSIDNDFAIIKLLTPVTFTDRVKPICLPSILNNYDSKVATVTGER